MRLFVISDGWGYKYGGINSFNYEFCCAIKQYMFNNNNEENFELYVISDISDNERDEFIEKTKRETLIGTTEEKNLTRVYNNLHCINIRKEEIKNSGNVIKLLESVALYDGQENYFIGHDVITGRVAIDCAKKYCGKSVVICHMAYAEYYSLLTDDEIKVDEKRQLQYDLFLDADIVFGVGDKLTKDVQNIILSENGRAIVRRILPGFNSQQKIRRGINDQFRVYFAGRIEYIDDMHNNNTIKQYDLVVKTFCQLIKDKKIPAASKLYLCGIANNDAKSHVKDVAKKVYNGIADIELISYAKHDDLMRILRGSSVAVMPSFSEGFGLVAVEAITVGVPIVISKNSGIYELLERERLTNNVKSFEVRGNDKEDIGSLQECLMDIYQRQQDYSSWTASMKDKLSDKFDWLKIVGNFIKHLHSAKFYRINSQEFENSLIELFFPKTKKSVEG